MYGLEPWIAPNDKICVLVLDIQVLSLEYMAETWLTLIVHFCSTFILPLSEKGSKHGSRQPKKFMYWIRLQTVCAENRLETSHAPNEEIRVLAFGIQHISLENGPKHDSRQLKKFVYYTATYSLSEMNMASEYDWHQLMRFVYCCSTFGLSVQNMDSKHDLRRLMNFVYWHSIFSLPVLSMGPKHAFRQIMKFFYWHPKFRLSVLNRGSKHDICQLIKCVHCWPPFRVSVLNMGPKRDYRQPSRFVYYPSTYSRYIMKMFSKIMRII